MQKRSVPRETSALQARIEELEAEVARLQGIIDEDAGLGYEPGMAYVDAQESIRAKGGEVGTITGPPILGTEDTINAGRAKP